MAEDALKLASIFYEAMYDKNEFRQGLAVYDMFKEAVSMVKTKGNDLDAADKELVRSVVREMEETIPLEITDGFVAFDSDIQYLKSLGIIEGYKGQSKRRKLMTMTDRTVYCES